MGRNKKLDIAVIGAGVVGQATGKGFARLGHKVTFYDLNKKVVEDLRKQGYTAEPHHLTHEFDYDIVFVCISEKWIDAEELALWRKSYHGLYVIRSTVPVGTCKTFNHICHNPEFLREALAEYEFMNPHRIIIGECCEKHGDVLEELYRPFNFPIVRTDVTTSEMIKLASNAYLATNISFWNQINLIADKVGVNSHVVGKACSLDPRISDYGASMHGKSYGGKCLPKDVAHLKLLAMQNGVTSLFLDAVKEINDWMKVKK